MNPKFKIGLAAAVILAVVLAIFWRPADRPAEAAPTAAPAAKLAAAPLPDKPTTVIAKPAMASLPVSSSTTVPPATAAVTPAAAVGAATAPTSDPQAEMNTAVDDMISLLRSSEILAFYEKYTPPAVQAKWSDAQRDSYVRADALAKANPSGAGMLESLISGFESIRGQTPQMNGAGDEATFEFTMQPPPGMDAPPRVSPMVMVKINGKWYVKMF